MTTLTVRVYGLIMNAFNEILLSRECFGGMEFTKFPGGGLEFGEGTCDTLRREIREELGVESIVGEHVYTSDFFVESAFAKGVQVISVYYKVELLGEPLLESNTDGLNKKEQFYWIKLSELNEGHLTFPFDKHVVSNFLKLDLNDI